MPKKLTLTFLFCKSVEGNNGIVEGWLIVCVNNGCIEDSMLSTWHALYQGPKPNIPQGNPVLLQSHMQLYCRSWMTIHGMDINHGLVPKAH